MAALEGQRGKAPHKAPNRTLKVVPSSTEDSPAGSRTVAVKSCDAHISLHPYSLHSRTWEGPHLKLVANFPAFLSPESEKLSQLLTLSS